LIDAAVSVPHDLIIACQREVFPKWAEEELLKISDGRLLTALSRLLEELSV